MSPSAAPRIVVLGAGVTGLTTALLLTRAHPEWRIVVAAKHMPGDYAAEYASPWAGANYGPLAAGEPNKSRWEQKTWPELERLARDVPEAGLHFQELRTLSRDTDTAAPDGPVPSRGQHAVAPWLRDLAPDFRALTTVDELRHGAFDHGVAYTSVCVNVPVYLAWLVGQCRVGDVRLERRACAHVRDAAAAFDARAPAPTAGRPNGAPPGPVEPAAGGAYAGPGPLVVVNCTGLGARALGGVEDAAVAPARGQTVLVRNALRGIIVTTSGTDAGEDEACYAMERAAGGGTILGGCYQKGNWEGEPDMALAKRIMERCVAVAPQLVGEGQGVEGLDVVSHRVGLRPVREGGTRVERERVEGLSVVHSYGHGGFGYQSSYGCAEEVVGLVEEAVKEPKA